MSRQGTSGATKMELTAIATHSGSDSDEEEVSPAQTISSLEGEVQPLKVQHPGVLQHGFRAYLCRSLRILLVGTPGDRPWLNALLLLVPFVFMSNSFGWGNGVTFALALLAICPFAERLNFVTEDLTKYTNATLGGLLNASFGNVTEMIVSIMAMRKGELWIIQASMLGSILSNLLLVLGSAFFVGGCRRHRSVGTGSILQKFNLHAANVNISLLLLCVAAFSLPSILVSDLAAPGWEALPSVDNVSVDATPAGKSYSVVAAVFLLLVYALYLLFQLKTHRDIFDDDDDDDDTDPPVLGFWGAMWWLGVATIFISFLSDILVDSFTSATGGIGIPDVFVWTILVPIVGNAAEHASAVIFAFKDRMSVAVSVAVGSAAQIGIFVVPFLVIVSSFMAAADNSTALTFAFSPFSAGSLLLAVLLAGNLLQAQRSHWLGGVFLVCLYILIAAGLWQAPVPGS